MIMPNTKSINVNSQASTNGMDNSDKNFVLWIQGTVPLIVQIPVDLSITGVNPIINPIQSKLIQAKNALGPVGFGIPPKFVAFKK